MVAGLILLTLPRLDAKSEGKQPSPNLSAETHFTTSFALSPFLVSPRSSACTWIARTFNNVMLAGRLFGSTPKLTAPNLHTALHRQRAAAHLIAGGMSVRHVMIWIICLNLATD